MSADQPQASGAEYAVRFTAREGVLHAQVSGDIDAQRVRIAYWRDIAAEGKARRLRRLLVTDRKKGHPATPPELAELAQLFRGEAGHFDRVAVVEPTLEFLPDIEHAEILGRVAGINVRVFGDPVQAERWLRYGEDEG